MELKLNIYGNNGAVEKTFVTESYKLKMKILKRFIEVVDLKTLSALLTGVDNEEENKKLVGEIGKMISGSYEIFQDLILSVFPEMKEEEFEEVALDDLAVCIIKILKSMTKTILISATGKN